MSLMLPFSRIACSHCRNFAIRSFASAVEAAPNTSANSTSADLEKTALLGGRSSKKITRRPSSAQKGIQNDSSTILDREVPLIQPKSSALLSNDVFMNSKNSYDDNADASKANATLMSFIEEQRQLLQSSDTYKPVVDDTLQRQIRKAVKAALYEQWKVYKSAKKAWRASRLHKVFKYRASVRKAARLLRAQKSRNKKKPFGVQVQNKTIIIPTVKQVQPQVSVFKDSSNTRRKAALLAAAEAKAKGLETHGRNKTRSKKKPAGLTLAGLAAQNQKLQKTMSALIGSVPSMGSNTSAFKATSESGFSVQGEDQAKSDTSNPPTSLQQTAQTLDELLNKCRNPKIDNATKKTVLEEIHNRLIQAKADFEAYKEEMENKKIEESIGPIENITDSSTASSEEKVTAELSATKVKIASLPPPGQAEVATLAHDLQRVLFSPGIHWLQDPRSGHFNYTKDIQAVADRDDFDFERLPRFVRPSEDQDLRRLLSGSGRKFAGSTSSLTSAMSQIYFALNSRKQLNTQTTNFVDQPRNFTAGARVPASISLRLTQEGTYLVDADKSFEKDTTPAENILSELGHVLERQLTMPQNEFSRFLKSSDKPFAPHEMRDKREAYHYSATPNLVMRSQLDCHDSRLPRSTFDIKTRATVAIRLDRLNYLMNRGYLIRRAEGFLGSFEREKYDLIRSAFLKYSMQVRIGQMDGIFLAYHSTGRIFGFEYLSLEDLDNTISGSTEESDQAFKLCVGLLESIFERVTADQPNTTLRLHFKGSHGTLQVLAEPRPSAPLDENATGVASEDHIDVTPSSPAGAQGINSKNKKDKDDSENDNDGDLSNQIKLYNISITNFLNGRELKANSPVDFASLQINDDEGLDKHASASVSKIEDSKKKKLSAFNSRLIKRWMFIPGEPGYGATAMNGSTASKEIFPKEGSNSSDSRIDWSIQYNITTSDDQEFNRKQLMRIREAQRGFNKFAVLPEGLTDEEINLITNLNEKKTKNKKLDNEEDGKNDVNSNVNATPEGSNGMGDAKNNKKMMKGKKVDGDDHGNDTQLSPETEGHAGNAIASVPCPTKQASVAKAAADSGEDNTLTTPFSSSFRPRRGVTYKTTPTPLVRKIRREAAKGRLELQEAMQRSVNENTRQQNRVRG